MEGRKMEETLLQQAEHVSCDGQPIDPKMRHFIRTRLDWAILHELQGLIYKHVRKDCAGCQVDHPSQLKHTLCLFSTSDDWIDLYLDIALKQVNLFKVIEHWYPEVQEKNPSGNEILEACQYWTHIKQDFQDKTSDESWIATWTERLKFVWKNGYHTTATHSG